MVSNQTKEHYFHRTILSLIYTRRISWYMSDESDDSGGGDDSNGESGNGSGRDALSGQKKRTRNIQANAGAKEESTETTEKSGEKDSGDGGDGPSARGESFPRSIKPDDTSSDAEGSDGGSESSDGDSGGDE